MNARLLATALACAGLAACTHAETQAPAPITTAAMPELSCVQFEWASAAGVSERAAILLPATVNGRATTLQLDTGADINVLRGPADVWSVAADENGWGAASVHIGELDLGEARVRTGGEAGELGGTLGLPALLGQVVVLDYPAQQFCLSGTMPAALGERAHFVGARIENMKFWFPVQVNGTTYENFFFDTGASLFPLSTDLELWRQLTGDDPEAADHVVEVNSWGNTIQLRGSAATGEAHIGDVSLGRPLIYHVSAAPTFFADWGFSFPVHGLAGNASFFDSVLVLDLRPDSYRLGIIPAGQ